MTDIRELRLNDLQPSQFCISQRKLNGVRDWFDPNDLSGFEPIQVKMLDGVPVMTDGHTRATAALLCGLDRVPLCRDEDDLDLEMYRRCVSECRSRGIVSAADLQGRIISEEDYEKEWNMWCDRMQAEVIRERTVIEERDPDDELINDLIRLSAGWEAENSCYGYRKNEQADIEGNRIFVAEDGDKRIGYLFGHIESAERATSIMPDGTPFFEVEELFVLPEYRRKGIGKLLFLYAERSVRGEADYIMLSTATKNWKAVFHFYLDELGMEFWSARLFKRVKQSNADPRRVLVIGSPGSGKSTFARKLRDRTGLPLHYLDMLFHKPDRSTVSREEFDERLSGILETDQWIIDGNYQRTLPLRFEKCTEVYLFDLPVEQCLEGAASRIGKTREDMPWIETEFDPEFRQYILDFPKDQMPRILELTERYADSRRITVFHSRQEADAFLLRNE